MTSTKRRLWVAAACAAALSPLLTATEARAQARGFALDRFEPSDRGSSWLTGESLDWTGHLKAVGGLVNDGAVRPLAVYNEDGSLRSSIVRDQIFVDLGASLALVDRVRVSFSMPVAVHEDGEVGTLGGVTYQPPGSFAAGDLRLAGDVRLYGAPADPFRLAVGLRLFLPTGSRDDFTSDGSVRVQPRILAAGDIGAFAYAAQTGIEYRGLDDTIGGVKLGSELTFGASAGARLAHRRLLIGPEVLGSTILSSGEVFSGTATPVNVLLGLHYEQGEIRVGGGGGAGITSGLGSPSVRWALSFEWAPGTAPPPPPPPAVGTSDPDPQSSGPR